MKKCLVYSDSLFENLDLSSNAFIHVESYPGLTAREAVNWLEDNDPRSLRYAMQENRYESILICLGTNDLGQGENVESIIENIKKLQTFVSNANVQVFVTLCNEKNTNITKFNQLLDFHLDSNTEFFEFFVNIHKTLLCKDGLHLNEKGKKALIQELIEYFN